MRTVEIDEAKIRLSALLADVEERGEHVVICRNGTPIAELRPFVAARDPFRTNAGLAVEFREDPVAPLASEDWPGAGE